MIRALFVKSVPGVKRLLAAGANPTVRIPGYVTLGTQQAKELSKIIDSAIKKWKQKKAGKK